jgi:hypothetical protein
MFALELLLPLFFVFVLFRPSELALCDLSDILDRERGKEWFGRFCFPREEK